MARRSPRDPVVAIIGTTGTGKSQLAVDIALKYNGEIINADAVQMYDGLPIITNKIPVDERRGIPHHLLGCIGLEEQSWRVDKFVRTAGQVMAEIRRRGKLPIVVGGSHYYTQSLLFRDSLAVETPDNHQQQNGDRSPEDDEQEEVTDRQYPILRASTQEMLDRLQEVDPIMSARWHPNDMRKIRRSLEIYYTTGKRASDVYAEQQARRQVPNGITTAQDGGLEDGDATSDAEIVPPAMGLRQPTLFLWTHTPRDVLRDRVRNRVDKMVENGLIEEAKGLRSFAQDQEDAGAPVDHTKGVYISIGYKECLPYLSALEGPETEDKVLARLRDEAIDKTKTVTWQYAKNQERWIRIKLLRAIKQAGAEQDLRVLDTSHPGFWENEVSRPAFDAVRAFLDGDIIEDHSKGSPAAAAAVAALESINMKEGHMPQTQTCEVCDVTATTEQEWQKHITSNRHRKTVKAKQKKAESLHYRHATH